jgi:Fic family protein
MTEKQRASDIIIKKPKGSAVGRERVKTYNSIRKKIKQALEGKELTIPGIAEATGIEQAEVTYYLMTMRKFGEVEHVEDDDVDEYYCYRLKE